MMIHIAFVEGDRKLLSGVVPFLILHRPAITYPDNVGELAFATEWDVHSPASVSSPSVLAFDLPPWIAGQLIFRQWFFDTLLVFFRDSIVFGNRILRKDMLGPLRLCIWQDDALMQIGKPI